MMTSEEHAAKAEALLERATAEYEAAQEYAAARDVVVAAAAHVQSLTALAQVHALLALRPAPDDDPGGSAGG